MKKSDKSPQSLQYIKGIGPRRAGLLEKMGIKSELDLLYHFPRRYEDRTKLKNIQNLAAGENATIQVSIVRVEEMKPRRGLVIIRATVRDESGVALAVWFNQSYLKKQLQPGLKVILTGKVSLKYGQKEINVNDYEVVTGDDSLQTAGIVPYYPSTEGLNQKFWRSVQHQLAGQHLLARQHPLGCKTPQVREIFTPEEREQYQLLPVWEALNTIHFPPDFLILERARYRLVFEEVYLLQLALGLLREARATGRKGLSHVKDHELLHRFEKSLPFQFTGAQKRVISEINSDMEAEQPMQRLIQGDVGSGKTVIAAWGLLKAVCGGYQGVLMAPTEILAQQHYDSLKEWFAPLGVSTILLTGSLGAREKDSIQLQIANQEYDVIIGTHALIQERVTVAKPGLIVIDEQHRFGVKQRALLEEKGACPDILVMTATPIPRTLAMTLYGDLDISVLNELPPGRQPVETYCITTRARNKLNDFLKLQLARDAQVFVVCPLVDEAEIPDRTILKNAIQVAENMQKDFPGVRVGLLHGRMGAREKEIVMEEFRQGLVQILVSTTVIEVGVNIPRATVMVVENAERFGLAQLHQLRGRVGRGVGKSYCILVTASRVPQALQRLKVMTEVQDGFRLAEEDLKIRGPGEFFGMRQHGLPEFKLADLSRDGDIISQARHLVRVVLKNDPKFSRPEHTDLLAKIRELIDNMVKY